MKSGLESLPGKSANVPEPSSRISLKTAFISTVHGHHWPGSEYLWSACAENLLSAKHAVFVNVSKDLAGAQVLQRLQASGAEVDYAPGNASRLARVRENFLPPYGKLKRFNPELLIVSSGSGYDPVYQPALGRFLLATDIPFIFICHFNAETFWVDDGMRQIMGRILQKAARVVFVSRDNQRLTERQLAERIPRAEVIVPPLLLNLPEPLPWPGKDSEGNWRLACVARLEPRWKGQDVLFEVLAEPRWKNRNYKLSLFGQGSESEYLKKLSNFYGLENKVVFAGFASPEAIWREHHLQILAARGEGGPMVITEGMMCGRAAVTTRCGFNAEYIIDGNNGFLAECSTPECLGAKLEESWHRREEWKEMGQRAHQTIRAHFADFNAPESLLKLILSGSTSQQ